MVKKALITGITGQDGSYLAEFLISKNYEVHGIKRRSSLFNTQRIEHLYQDIHFKKKNFHLHYGDLTDTISINNLIEKIKPDEIYNLGAQSHVAVSFELVEYTANVDALGTLRILEAIKNLELLNTKFYQASTSELYGLVSESPQNEATEFYPRSPYGFSKLFAYWAVRNYREAYGMFACNGILFNHESPRRGETFVTRKITRGLSRIALGLEKKLFLGNLDAKRDWGHAKDFVKAQWMMLQEKEPLDYVIATGKQYTIREFLVFSAKNLGIELEFRGKEKNEVGFVKAVNSDISPALKKGDEIIFVDEKYFRPTEVDSLLGDPSLAKSRLGWEPSISVEELCKEMVEHDYNESKKQKLLIDSGYNINNSPNIE